MSWVSCGDMVKGVRVRRMDGCEACESEEPFQAGRLWSGDGQPKSRHQDKGSRCVRGWRLSGTAAGR